MLAISTGISQPTVSIIEGDTVITFSIAQGRKLAVDVESLKLCREEREILHDRVEALALINNNGDQIQARLDSVNKQLRYQLDTYQMREQVFTNEIERQEAEIKKQTLWKKINGGLAILSVIGLLIAI